MLPFGEECRSKKSNNFNAQLKMKDKNPGLCSIIFSLIFCFICICCVLLGYQYLRQPILRLGANWPNEVPYHSPDFSKSNFEFAGIGDSFYIFSKGQIPSGRLTFAVAETINSRQELVKLEPKSVNYVERSLLVPSGPFTIYRFDAFNVDCFAKYVDGEFIRDINYLPTEGRLPSPSDTWMCAGFDFPSGYQYLKN